MEELTITDTVYLAMAVRSMLEKDLNKTDREAYERLWYKMKISHKGQRIMQAFNYMSAEERARILN